MRRHAGGVDYSLGLVDVTRTVGVLAFWKMAARVMRKWRGWNGLRMDLGAGFDGGFVNFNFGPGKNSRKGRKGRKGGSRLNYGSEWRL